MERFLLILDFIGTFAFAISGATIGVRHRLDLFGVLVLAFATATFGGILRDILIGATPAALANWIYLALACSAGLMTFYRHGLVERLRNDWPLAEGDSATFYGGGAAGYVDYPAYRAEAEAEPA